MNRAKRSGGGDGSSSNNSSYNRKFKKIINEIPKQKVDQDATVNNSRNGDKSINNSINGGNLNKISKKTSENYKNGVKNNNKSPNSNSPFDHQKKMNNQENSEFIYSLNYVKK